MGRSTGSMKVFSRLNTRVMKIPSGFVTAKISVRKTKICNQPLMVISEFLRTQQCVQQIHRGQHTDGEHDRRFQAHIVLLTSGGRKNAHRRSTSQKKRPRLLQTLRPAYWVSHVTWPPYCRWPKRAHDERGLG